MDQSLIKVIGDLPDTDIKKTVIKAEDRDNLGDKSFTIWDGTTTVELEAEPREAKKLEVGLSYTYYNLERVSPKKLKMGKSSYAKKVKIDMKEEVDDQKTIRLENLIGKKEKVNIGETLAVKVFQVGEEMTTSNGKSLR